MSSIYLDTHICVWLHDGIVRELSAMAQHLINTGEQVLISPMVLLEFDYLAKRKRINTSAKEMMAVLHANFGITLCNLPFEAVAAAAIEVEWTPDPFDRLIVAQAILRNRAPLITKDTLIRDHYAEAVW